MRLFVIKILILAALGVLPAFCYIVIFANGTIDEFYKKFTLPESPSLVLGTSRSTHGILPEVFNKSNLKFDRPLINFGFANIISLYGPAYYNVIKKKLKPNVKNGLFILEVSPMSISILKKNAKNRPVKFEEDEYDGWKLSSVSANPNIEYIMKVYNAPLYTMLYRNLKNSKNSPVKPYVKGLQKISAEVKDDGYFDVELPMDSLSVEQRKVKLREYFIDYLSQREYSTDRELYLRKTIEFLKSHGKVYLVRLPIECGHLSLENKYMPEFNQRMQGLSDKYDVEYIDLSEKDSSYLTLDSEHLVKKSGEMVSREILQEISKGGSIVGLNKVKSHSFPSNNSLSH
jgi:hypothetical protein